MIQPHCIPHRFWKICSGTHVSCIKETERVVFQQMTGCVNSRSSQFKKRIVLITGGNISDDREQLITVAD